MKMTKFVEDQQVRFYTIPNGRWVFAGCRNPAGYVEIKDAIADAKAQITNESYGPLNTK